MSQEQDKRYFEVTVEGQYHALHIAAGTPTLKNYTAKFVLPSQEAALSIICKHLLNPYLAKNYPDFIRFRTHKLVSIEAHGRVPDTSVLQMSLEDMSVAQLSDFCILKQIMIDPYKHSDLPKCRELVSKIYSTMRQLVVDEKTAKIDVSMKEVDALFEANGLKKESAVKIKVNERKATQAAMGGKFLSTAKGRKPVETIEEDQPLPPLVEDEGIS